MGLAVTSASNFLFTWTYPAESGLDSNTHEPIWALPYIRFTYHAEVIVQPDSPLPPKPRKSERWRIGIVQNELPGSRITVGYEGKDPIQIETVSQMLDVSPDPLSRPFPKAGPLFYTDYHGMPQVDIHEPMLAVVTVEWGADGLKVLAAESNLFSNDFDRIPHDRAALTFSDAPKLDVPARGGSLRRLEMVSKLQAWVLAESPSKDYFTLAQSDPFTIVQWLKVQRADKRDALLSMYGQKTGADAWHVRGDAQGFETWPKGDKRLTRFQKKQGTTVTLRPVAPARLGPAPTITGNTAVEWAETVMRDRKLLL